MVLDKPSKHKSGQHGKRRPPPRRTGADRSAAREAEAAAQRAASLQQQQDLIARGHTLFEYRVITLKETLIGDKIDHSAMEMTLNQWAAQAWHVRSITSASVSGRVGPGGVGGLIATLLARQGHAVICLARPETAAYIHRHGLRVISDRYGEVTARVRGE